MANEADMTKLFREARLLANLDAPTQEALRAKLRRVVYGAGQTLCVEGETGDRMFIIERGEVAVLKEAEGAGPVEITALSDGAVAGEMSLLRGVKRSATLRARRESVVWELSSADFRELLERCPGVCKALLHNLAARLHRETSLVAKLLSKDVDRRLRVAFFDAKPYMEEAFTACNPHGYAWQFLESRLTPQTVALAAGCAAVCIFVNDQVNAEVVEGLEELGVGLIVLRCAGFNHVDLAACGRAGLSVARVPAYSPHAVAEHAVALMLALNRHTHRANSRVREGNFSLTGLVGFDMHGKTAGVIGTGKIGQCAMNILHGFGCALLAYDKFPNQDFARSRGARYVDLDTLLAESDIITLHAPLTPETHHLISAAAIRKMKPGVMLINTGRGGLLDAAALLDGLKSRKIGYAGLDVYEEESAYFFEDFSADIISDDVLARLTTFNNVLVTSHQAFLTREALANIAAATVENIREYELGKRGAQLTNAVAGPAATS